MHSSLWGGERAGTRLRDAELISIGSKVSLQGRQDPVAVGVDVLLSRIITGGWAHREIRVLAPVEQSHRGDTQPSGSPGRPTLPVQIQVPI